MYWLFGTNLQYGISTPYVVALGLTTSRIEFLDLYKRGVQEKSGYVLHSNVGSMDCTFSFYVLSSYNAVHGSYLP